METYAPTFSQPKLQKQRLSLTSKVHLLYQGWNTWLNLFLIVLSVSTARTLSTCWPVILLQSFGIYLLCQLVCDWLYYKLEWKVVDPEAVVRHGYNFAMLLDDHGSAHGHGLDYGFNWYNGDYTKTRRQAQVDKYEHAFAKLGLKPGMRVLDCGCGCGDWLHWLKHEKNIEVTGINITDGQVALCHSRGLDVININWKEIAQNPELQKRLYGKFDAVTFWDTVEHYVPAVWRYNKAAQNNIYCKMFDMARSLLDPDSPCRRVWISCLHIDESEILQQDWSNRFCNYLLDKFHSGNYPDYHWRQITHNAQKEGFYLLSEENLTDDYHKTSVLSPEHFGKLKFRVTGDVMETILLNCMLDLNWLQRLLWLGTEIWMCQFDESNMAQSPKQLLWLLYQQKAE